MAGTVSKAAATPGPALPPAIRPVLTFRVGVAGVHSIPAASEETIRGQVKEILRSLSEELGKLAANSRVKDVYETDAAQLVPVNLRIVSSLGEGADRLVAEEALKLDYRLVAPLPFDRLEYENDFPDSAESFRQFASQAQVVELDGARGESETASYDAVGRFMVRNCDLLIAIWDGAPAQGRDRTADIMRFAVRSGLPVWWIDLHGKAPRLIAAPRQWRRHDLALNVDKARSAIVQYLANTIVPSDAPEPVQLGIMRYALRWPYAASDDNASPLTTYLYGKHNAVNTRAWGVYSLLLRRLAPGPRGALAQMAPPISALEHWWENNYRRADALSILYGNAYRSSYVLVIGFSAGAFLASAIGGYAYGAFAPTYELYALMFIFSLVALNHKLGWQEKWITYRLLAELCRKQFMLSPLGRTLPGIQVNRTAEEVAENHEGDVPPSEAWVGWYFLALTRCAPMPEGGAVAAKERALSLGRSLIAEQGDYHRVRQMRSRTADRRLAFAIKLFFGLTVAVLLLRLVPFMLDGLFGPTPWADAIERISWVEIGSVLSAMTAACVGLRTYAEFALVARQSLHMREIMTEFSVELNAIDLSLPLASQDLGSTLHRLAILMMQEVGGWAQLFRLKSVETA